MIKKADIILGVILILFGLATSFVLAADKGPGQDVSIQLNGKDYAIYSLAENKSFTVKEGNSINKINIKDGEVSMTYSNCKNHDCIKQGKISKAPESIICLPHKLVIQIQGGEKEYDSVSQ
ncbi:MAG: NusG domain II-containing protein [Anaerovoracaceae bacterium]